jgi:hypothetical protein
VPGGFLDQSGGDALRRVEQPFVPQVGGGLGDRGQPASVVADARDRLEQSARV